MIFPFEIKFKRAVRINSTMDQHEVLAFIKKTVTGESPYLKKQGISKHVFSFNVDFWGVGRGSTFDGVSKGIFTLDKSADGSILTYSYRIGGASGVVLPFFFGIPFLLILLKDFKKNTSLIPSFLLVYLSVSILFWLITLYKMNSLFKRVVEQVESKWKL